MSRVEDALKKLQKGRNLRGGEDAGSQLSPMADKKKVRVEGPKHRISREDLVNRGLLSVADESLTDDFRKIKRPLIRNAISLARGTEGYLNVIMVASPILGAGKTFCAVNLAVSVSLERELNVLLVDADVAKPHISDAFSLRDSPGLMDLLVDDGLDISETLVRTDLNDIQVLPAGRGHPEAAELLSSERMSSVIRELASRYSDRIILFDSPPLLMTSEAQALMAHAGQIVLIIEAGDTPRQVLFETIEMLDPNKAVNLVLNKSRHWSQAGYYYEDYASGRHKGP